MDTRDQAGTKLEAALIASWDRDTLAVYADYLVERGDPRGELIAIDLELEQRSTPELVARRASLLTAWLGQLVPNDPHTPWIGDSFRLGFVDDLVLDGADPNATHRLATMLASPLAPYLKRVTVRGDADYVAITLRTLARARHEWLVELCIVSPSEPPEDANMVDDELVAAIIEATPRLDLLDVDGARVVGTFSHPSLRRLRLTGWAAVGGIFDETAPLRAVTSLDLAIRQRYIATPRANAPLHLPALRRLDLTRNEPQEQHSYVEGYDPEYDPDDDVYLDEDNHGITALEFLGSQPIRQQLTHVRLPSLRAEADFVELQAIVGGMPHLEEIEIARSHYFRAPELANTRARFVRPPAWPWPQRAKLSPGERLVVVVPGSRSGDEVTLDDAVGVMERRFEDLAADARYAWTRFWVFVDELGKTTWKQDAHHAWTDERAFPADLLVAALEACDIGGSGGWRELREQVRYRRPMPAGSMVTVHRVR